MSSNSFENFLNNLPDRQAIMPLYLLYGSGDGLGFVKHRLFTLQTASIAALPSQRCSDASKDAVAMVTIPL